MERLLDPILAVRGRPCLPVARNLHIDSDATD